MITLLATADRSTVMLDESSIKVVKLSTVSTGNLKAFQPVQLRPINRVVYPGSLAH